MPFRREALPTLALLGVTASWGSTFFLIKDLLRQVSVLDFLSIRFAIAAVALICLAPRALRRLSRADVGHGVVLGLVYGAAQVLQTYGLAHTPASVSGFVTGMYVVLTPILAAVLLRQRISGVVWLAVVLSAAGLGVLSLHGFDVSEGVLLIFCSAILYALHIVGLGQWSSRESVVGLAAVQMVVIAIVCTAAGAPDGIGLPNTGGGWLSMVYMAIVAAALAMLAQSCAQSQISATRTAIIMTMEPVFAAFFAVLFGGEPATVRMMVGGGLVLLAMYLVELWPRRHSRTDEVSHLAP